MGRSSSEDEPRARTLDTLLDSYPIKDYTAHAVYRAATAVIKFVVDLDAPLLLAALLAEANIGADSDSAAFVLRRLSGRELGEDPDGSVRTQAAIDALDLKRRDVSELPPARHIQLAESLDVAGEALNISNDYRQRTASASDSKIDNRHMIAALLRFPDVRKILKARGLSLVELRNELYKFIAASHPDDNAMEWRRILLGAGFEIRTMVAGDTWTTSDNLGYRLYAEAIAESLLSTSTRPPLTIGIQAPWGQGKTSLMRMIQERLDPNSTERDLERQDMLLDVGKTVRAKTRHLLAWLWSRRGRAQAPPDEGMLPVKERTIPTVWFNPLYYRDSEQVWAGMGHAILQQLAGQLEPLEREKFWLHLQIARMNAGALRREVYQYILMRALPAGLAGMLLALVLERTELEDVLTGGGLGTLAGMLWTAAVSPVSRRFEQYVTEPDYQSNLGLLHLVDHDLDKALSLLVGRRPIAVFIDDLDRCDPQTVNQVILAINQFLSLPRRNVFFFLGMDMEMVAAALEQAQKDVVGSVSTGGRSFGWRFMEKFVQLPFVIPHLDERAARSFAAKHLSNESEEEDAEALARVRRKIETLKAAEDVGTVAKEELASASPAVAAEIQQELCRKAAELIGDPDSDEIEKIVAIAIEDLDLNPRTIKRYFALVRLLRNVQLATGQVKEPDFDRKLVLRAAHLLMNFPQFVQWLRGTSSLADIEAIASSSDTHKRWCDEVKKLLGDQVPAHVTDAPLYRFVRKISGDRPGLAEMHAARMF